MDISIRPAVAEDAAKIAQVHVESWQSTYAGFASAGPSRHPFRTHRAEVYTIYFRDEYHGVGAGRELFADAVGAVGEARGPSIIVWCLSGNPSRYFYEAMGGALVARRRSKVGAAAVEEVGYGWSDISDLAVWAITDP